MLVKNLYNAYVRDTGGNFATMFGILAVPILISTGMAIDISRTQSYDRQLQDAVDAASLFAVTYVETSDDDDDDDDEDNQDQKSPIEAATKEVLLQNLGDMDFTLTDFDLVEFTDGSVALTVHGKIPAMFAQINGFPQMAIAADAGALAESGGDLEVAIAFDTTNSMGFDNTWTKALDTLDLVLDELDEYTGDNNFFVSLVPFSDRVNVGRSNSNWIKGSEPTNWNGCMEPREEDNGTVTWALTDAKPTGNDRFDASIPGTTGGLATRGGSYPFCPNVAIVPPTNNPQNIIDAAAAFTKAGTGRFDVGMAWTWRMMAGDWRGHWSAGGQAAANNGHNRRQIAIMITDGRTNAYRYEVDEQDSWGWNEGSVGGFENMVAVCDEMKDDGMEIFMVRIDGNEHAAGYMRSCATSPDYYYEINDNADLEVAFTDILKVVKSNLVLTQ